MRNKQDHQLIEAARQGNIDAINALLIQHHTDVRRFAHSVCATHEDAEDAIQETLWIMSRKIGSLRVASALISWLFQVVKRECHRLLRIRHRELPIDAIPEQQDRRELNGMQSLMVKDIEAAIEKLPLIYRQVLVMRGIEEMSVLEIAVMSGITVEAVKSRLHRARNMLVIGLDTPNDE